LATLQDRPEDFTTVIIFIITQDVWW